MESSSLCVGNVCTAAGDRGYDFHPVNWEQCDFTVRSYTSSGWCFQNADLRVSLTPPGGLVGSTGLVPEPQIENLSSSQILLLTPILGSKGAEFAGSFGSGRSQRTLEPRASEDVAIWFDLGGPMRDTLGTSARIRLSYRIGHGPIVQSW